MLPLIGLAATFLPDLIKLIAGDKAGTIAGTVAQAVTDIAGTSDPVAAKQKLDADPAATVALQQKLAEIALDAQKAQNAELDQQRQDELAELKANIQNTADARSTMLGLASAKSPIAWGSPIVSAIVTIGFFVILIYLMEHGINTTGDNGTNVANIINIAIGVLGTAFATVVNFWLGSSSGSRNKDQQAITVQQAHAAQTDKMLSTIQSAQAAHQEAIGSAVTAMKDVAASAVRAAHPAPAEPVQAAPTAPAAPAAPTDNFDRCVELTLAQEGGFVDNPADPGGATNLGITLNTLKAWRGADVTVDDVRHLTKAEAIEIYRANYWLPAGCGELPGGVDLMVFDFGVNAGPRTSVKLLQKTVGVTDDGSVGPRTKDAVNAVAPRDLIGRLSQARLAYYDSLANFPTFGRGWTNRTNQVTAAALSMVQPATS